MTSIKHTFYNNCPISRTLIGSCFSSIRVQIKFEKLGLARTAICKWATWRRQTCLSKTLFIPSIWPVLGLVIVKNQIDISFYASVLLCVCPSLLRNHSPAASGSTGHFDNVMQFIINKRTDTLKNWCQFGKLQISKPSLENISLLLIDQKKCFSGQSARFTLVKCTKPSLTVTVLSHFNEPTA